MGEDNNNKSSSKLLKDLPNKIKEKVERLKIASDKQGLYLDCENRSKDTVEFPRFNGEVGESVHEFAADFCCAMTTNQVAERHKVAKLDW